MVSLSTSNSGSWLSTINYIFPSPDSVQFTQSCLTLCDSMDCSMPGFPVHHQLPELTQTHVRWVSGAIQPSHPLLSPYPPSFNISQHQGLFKESSPTLQFKSINSSVPAFFIVQLSHPYVTTGKTIALTRWTFVGKVMSLLFNILSRLVYLSFQRVSVLISWLLAPSAVILEPHPNKVCHCFHCFPIYLPWSDGTRCRDLSFLNVEL